MKNENQRSAAHAAASGVSVADMDRTEISGIEEILLVELDDYASRHAQLHRQAGAMRDRAAHLELERSVDEACGGVKAKKPARVPRDTEPCNLVRFLGIVSGGAAAAVIGAALLGWAGKEAFDALASALASIPGVR